MPFRRSNAAVFAIALAACGGGSVEDAPVLVLGDSVMAWNAGNGASVADALSRELGTPVASSAQSGARVSHPNALARAAGFEIASQAVGKRHDWVVLDGGANDLAGECACRNCDAVLDELASPDGASGEIPALVERLQRDSGARVLLMGYYGPNGRGGAFDDCEGELTELDRRMSRIAETRADVEFIDSGEVLSAARPELYDSDNVHPAPEGSVQIGRLLARALRNAGFPN